MPRPSSSWRPAALAVLVLGAGAAPASAGVRYRDVVAPGASVQRDVTYGAATNAKGERETLRLDVYRPRGDRTRNRRAIVSIHGGGFVSGDKAGGLDVRVAERFARLGYVTVSINYRLGARNGFDFIGAAQHDAQAAVRWVRAHRRGLRVDSSAISAAGISAGAITALRVAYNSEDPGTSGTPGVSSRVRAAVADAGAAIGLDVDPGEPPALLLHGTADTTLPYGLATSALQILRDGGVSARLVTYEGVGHTPLVYRFDEAFDQARRFLYRTGGRAGGRRTPRLVG